MPALEIRLPRAWDFSLPRYWEKYLTFTKLVASLKPIIQRGFPFTVKITSYGSGFEVEYSVEEIRA